MKNKMKWLIGLAIIVLAGLLITSNMQKNVIYSFNGEKVEADAYYDMLKTHYGAGFVYQFIEKEYFNTKTVDKEIKEELKASAESLLKENDNEEGKKMLETTLRSFGYSGINDLQLYLENSYLKNKMVEENFDAYFTDYKTYNDTYKPRIVTHILVMSDDEAVVDAKKKEIDAILNDSDDIKIDMLKLNDDEVVISEQLGYVDRTSSLDEAFLALSLNTEEKTLSDWVKSSYGYHRIYVESTNEKDIRAMAKFQETVLTNEPSLSFKIVLDQMQKDGVEIEKTLLDEILELAGL